MLVGMEVVQGREKEGGGEIGKGVGSQGLVLHSFFPSFVLLFIYTNLHVFLKNSCTSIFLHDMKWPYTIMHSHIHN